MDFSGHWKLNVADSDDPMHLAQIANGQAGGPAAGADKEDKEEAAGAEAGVEVATPRASAIRALLALQRHR